MPAADFRPAGASQYSTGGVCFLRSGPMSGPVRYFANACAAAFLSASDCSRTAMKPTPPHAVWSPFAFRKLAMSQFVPNFHFASPLSTLIIALGRWRIATSPAMKRACESLGFNVRKSGGMTFCCERDPLLESAHRVGAVERPRLDGAVVRPAAVDEHEGE